MLIIYIYHLSFHAEHVPEGMGSILIDKNSKIESTKHNVRVYLSNSNNNKKQFTIIKKYIY